MEPFRLEAELAYQGRHIHVKRKSRGKIALEWTITIIAAIALGILIRIFVASLYVVPSASMEDTILVGDKVFAEKLSYRFSEPERGDVVIFIDPEDPERFLVKRCIALEGETVDLIDGEVYIDGELLEEEEYTLGKPTYQLTSKISFPYKVPEGKIWVMGDNRTNSSDSRVFGAIPLDSLVAQGLCVLWPISDWHSL